MQAPIRDDNLTYLVILAFWGFLGFMSDPTAYTWTEQDIMPFLERFFNPNFLSNDFFTNTSVQKSPRWIYGHLIAYTAYITGLSWYKTMYLLKLILMMVFPILHFKVISTLLRRYLHKGLIVKLEPFIVLSIVLVVFFADYRNIFSIAEWPPYNPGLNASNVSLVFCFLAIIMRESALKPITYLPFFSMACLIHPAMGLFCVHFYIVFLVPYIKKEWKSILSMIIVGLASVLLIKTVFSTESGLDTSRFIEYYVIERHPWHYHVPSYSHIFGNWKFFFLIINLFFLIPLVYSILKNRRVLLFITLPAYLSYLLAIALQYFFIDVYPSKFMAYLGISRYTIFGYWSLVLIWALLISEVINGFKEFGLPSLNVKSFILLLLNLFFVGVLYVDNPKEMRKTNNPDFYDFVETTPQNATFLALSDRFSTDLRIVGNRAVFKGKEFPFVESAIAEYHHRYSLVHGSKQEETNGLEFYRAMAPKDFLSVANEYPLDYIVIEQEYAKKFASITPVWRNQVLQVYYIKDLKE